MATRFKNSLKSATLVAVIAAIIFWVGYGSLKGILFGAAVFGLLLLVNVTDHWWAGRRQR